MKNCHLLLDIYKQSVHVGDIEYDPEQFAALERLQLTYDQLVERSCGWKRWRHRAVMAHHLGGAPVMGVYLWGGVGIGKTYLLDSFFEHLPFQGKKRWHFHAFMQHIHHGLRDLAGYRDPLHHLAYQIRKETTIICFDELMVHDIADAMLLERLFNALFAHGITLVVTSNIHPDGLYENGLHRDRFLPAIDLLKRHLTVFEVASHTDYRLRKTAKTGYYLYPLDRTTQNQMDHVFNNLAHHGVSWGSDLCIDGRKIATCAAGSDVIWFDFDVICSVPRSQTDFLEIARSFNTLMLSSVPDLQQCSSVQITHFIHFIDILYDHRVKLIMSCDGPIQDMQVPDSHAFAFKRTQSRLQEMVGQHYLHTAHETH